MAEAGGMVEGEPARREAAVGLWKERLRARGHSVGGQREAVRREMPDDAETEMPGKET